jgi:hypothetical protein
VIHDVADARETPSHVINPLCLLALDSPASRRKSDLLFLRLDTLTERDLFNTFLNFLYLFQIYFTGNALPPV